MAKIVADRVKETSTTTGTGNLTLAGAVSGFLAFSARCANNDTFYYAVAHQSADEWEVGEGTYVSATPAIARTRVIASSNSDAAVNFSAGTKDVFITSPAIGQTFGSLTVTPSANQNDYNPTGLALANVLNVNASASIKFTGLAGGYEDRRILIRNASTDYLLWLENQNTASSAANRFRLPKGFPAFLMPGDSIELIYNDTADRWDVISWPNQGPAMGLTLFTDFDSLNTGSPAGGLAVYQNGTGASAQTSNYLLNTTERPIGLCQIDTGTTATGRVALGGDNTGSILPTLGAALSVARLAVEATVTAAENFQVFTGFMDCAVAGSPADGVAWNNRFNGSAAEWSQDRFNGGGITRSVTGSPTPDNNYIWLVVFINPNWTRADFIYSTDSVNFVKADSPTTGLPDNTRTTAWQAVSIIKSAGTTQRNTTIDLAGVRHDVVRG